MGVSHDDPEVTPPSKIRSDACVTVGDGLRPHGDIGVQVIAAGDYTVITHFGPYEKLLGLWLPRSGRELGSAPCQEFYLNSLENTAPEDLLTDIHAPLKPR